MTLFALPPEIRLKIWQEIYSDIEYTISYVDDRNTSGYLRTCHAQASPLHSYSYSSSASAAREPTSKPQLCSDQLCEPHTCLYTSHKEILLPGLCRALHDEIEEVMYSTVLFKLQCEKAVRVFLSSRSEWQKRCLRRVSFAADVESESMVKPDDLISMGKEDIMRELYPRGVKLDGELASLQAPGGEVGDGGETMLDFVSIGVWLSGFNSSNGLHNLLRTGSRAGSPILPPETVGKDFVRNWVRTGLKTRRLKVDIWGYDYFEYWYGTLTVVFDRDFREVEWSYQYGGIGHSY